MNDNETKKDRENTSDRNRSGFLTAWRAGCIANRFVNGDGSARVRHLGAAGHGQQKRPPH